MHTKFLLLATLLGGLTIFIWGAVSHTALELPGAMYPLQDGTAVIDAIRSQAPANGVYYDPRGLLAVVALRPDMADKSKDMGANLWIEFATNCAEALLLAFLLTRCRAKGVFERAQLTGLMGLVAFIGLEVSYWNWYGFSPRFVMGNLVDIVVGWYLAGLVLGWLMKKMRVEAQ
jgi:hypothetical protein